MIMFYDSRDMINILNAYMGKDKYTYNKNNGLYHVEKRYPITTPHFTHFDNVPITNPLQPYQIVDSDGVEVNANDISRGLIRHEQTKPNYHSETLEMLMYAVMYSNSKEPELYYNDPVFKSETFLIKYVFSTTEMDELIHTILSLRYPTVDDDHIETFSIAFYMHLSSGHMTMLENNIVYDISTDYDTYTLTPQGTPMEFRYYLEYLKADVESALDNNKSKHNTLNIT